LEADARIKIEGISKSFGPIKALRDVNFELGHKEIIGLVGDNAAGKSTLLKIISGAYQQDEGSIYIEGNKVDIKNPIYAQKSGIEIVYQDFMLAPNLDITANIFLGREIYKNWGFMRKLEKDKMKINAKKTLEKLGFDMDINSNVSNLSGGQQQTVAIARALHFEPAMILMDEPTASLSLGAVEELLERVKKVREHGASIIYVSHRIPEVIEIADRILVLRRGKIANELDPKTTNVTEIVKNMTGTSIN